MDLVWVILLSLLIGLLLGLLGGGGSILTVPVLVYLVQMEPKAAIATSLLVVGVTSLIAMINHARHGRVCWRTGFIFASAGMVGAYGGGRLAALVPDGLLLLFFAALMLGTAYALLRGRKGETHPHGASLCPSNLPILAILLDGFLVGGITGLVGAGGGFLVVPALNLLGGLPMHAAIGTSLLVIALKSFAALAGYVSHVAIDFQLAALVTLTAIAGSALAAPLSQRLSGKRLRQGFASLVILIAGWLLYQELTAALWLDVKKLLLEHLDFFWGAATMLSLLVLYWLRTWLHTQKHRHS